MSTNNKQSNKSKLLLYSSWAFVTALGAISIFVIWPKLGQRSPSDVIIVKAVNGPIKVKPLNPGGSNVAHQGLLVIDMLKNGIAASEDTESLRLDILSPEPPPISSEANKRVTTVKVLGKTANKLSNSAVNQTDEIFTAPQSTEGIEKPSKKSVSDEKYPIKKPTASMAQGPLFMIQLAAFRNSERAQEIASLLSEKHSSRLQGVRLESMWFDTGTNGVFFRVVSAPMSQADAKNVCSKLRRAGQDCFLRKFNAPEG